MQNADLTGKSAALEYKESLLSYIKIGKEIVKFGDIEIEKNKF